VTAHSILRLLPYSVASHPAGSIHYQGEDLLKLPERRLRGIRGNRIAMVFQEPMTSLNPLHTIEKQLAEVLALHKGLGGAKASARILELLELVGIPEPAKRLKAYPHELSGGQRQRVMIAMALACEPQLLIADEPTSALDVTIQAQIMALLLERVRALGASAIFVLHDLALATQVADRVAVMYAGQIVEEGPAGEVLNHPRHPYTQGLRASAIEFDAERLQPIAGVVPPLSAMPGGCRFAPRCALATERCREQQPLITARGPVRVACWNA
jgi:oligopeptide/dipeptide ABC transporter ATP-binding protein